MALPSVVSVEVLVLGSGSAEGIPLISCLLAACPTCPSCSAVRLDSRNERAQTSTVFRLTYSDGAERVLVIDCGSTFNASVIKFFPQHNIKRIDALLITHDHADAMGGIGYLRDWTQLQDGIPIYATQSVAQELRQTLGWAFSPASLNLKLFVIPEKGEFPLLGFVLHVFQVEHGKRGGKPYLCSAFFLPCNILVMTDCSKVTEENYAHIQSLQGSRPISLAIIDGYGADGTHLGLPSSIECAKRLKPQKCLLTQIHHFMSHADLERKASPYAKPAFDGYTIRVTARSDGTTVVNDGDTSLGQLPVRSSSPAYLRNIPPMWLTNNSDANGSLALKRR